MSRCDVPAHSSFDLPNSGRHPGFLHGPGPYAWKRGATVHWSKCSQASGLFVCVCVCAFVCALMCVSVCVLCLALGRCWWTAAAGSSSLHCALSFSLSKHTHTHTHTHRHTLTQTIKQTLCGQCPDFLQNNFFYAELFWLPCLFFFLTADWTACSTCLLVPWVPALSLWLC